MTGRLLTAHTVAEQLEKLVRDHTEGAPWPAREDGPQFAGFVLDLAGGIFYVQVEELRPPTPPSVAGAPECELRCLAERSVAGGGS